MTKQAPFHLAAVAAIAVTLAGCGTTRAPLANVPAQTSVGARSQAGVTRGMTALFRYVFRVVDANKDGAIDLPEWLVYQPKEAGFFLLDRDGDGRLTFNEYATPGFVKEYVENFRSGLGQSFATADRNGDRALSPAEFPAMKLTHVAFEDLDANQDGRLTLSELEDELAAMLVHQPRQSPVPLPSPPATPGPLPCMAKAPAAAPEEALARHGAYRGAALPQGWPAAHRDEAEVTRAIARVEADDADWACFQKFYPGAVTVFQRLAPRHGESLAGR